MAAGDSRAIARRVASRRANRESRSRVARARSVSFFTHPRDARPRSRARYCGRARATAREPGRRFARGGREGVANRGDVEEMDRLCSPPLDARGGIATWLFETLERGRGERRGVGGEDVDLALGRRGDGVVERGEGEAEVVGGVGARTGARRRGRRAGDAEGVVDARRRLAEDGGGGRIGVGWNRWSRGED